MTTFTKINRSSKTVVSRFFIPFGKTKKLVAAPVNIIVANECKVTTKIKI